MCHMRFSLRLRPSTDLLLVRDQVQGCKEGRTEGWEVERVGVGLEVGLAACAAIAIWVFLNVQT